MFYYKVLDKNGNTSRVISSTAPMYNAVEITEEEYRKFVPETVLLFDSEEDDAEILAESEV